MLVNTTELESQSPAPGRDKRQNRVGVSYGGPNDTGVRHGRCPTMVLIRPKKTTRTLSARAVLTTQPYPTLTHTRYTRTRDT
jgi:hypothetical protein